MCFPGNLMLFFSISSIAMTSHIVSHLRISKRSTKFCNGYSSRPLVKRKPLIDAVSIPRNRLVIYRPYMGQYYWFSKRHAENIPSAIERYKNEAFRVFGVLDNILSKQEWLVGNKMTIADLAFVM